MSTWVERLTAAEPAEGEPTPAKGTVLGHRPYRIATTGRSKPAMRAE